MSKFDELKKEAEIAIAQNWFYRLREEDAKAILELLAIQAQLVEALKGMDDSFCSIHEDSTKEERHQARMNLIAARAAIVAAGAQP